MPYPIAAVRGKGWVIEEATMNLVTNPSIEVDTTGWVLLSSVISRDTTYSMFGDAALKVITSNLVASEGAYFWVTAQTSASTEYTFSIYLRGSGTVRLEMWDGGAGAQTSGVITLTNTWTRYELTVTYGVGAARYVGVFTNAQQDVTFYCDGFQLEAKNHVTSYCDGSLGTAYAWTGIAHASTSSRI